MTQIIKLTYSLLLCFVFLNSSALTGKDFTAEAQTNRRRHPVSGVIAAKRNFAAERRERAFRIVWQTVKNEDFDPTFGGVDWDAVRVRYAPRVARVTSDQELHYLLQAMINELHQSHLAIIPPESIPRFSSRKSKAAAKDKPESDNIEADDSVDDESEGEGNADLTVRMMNGIGIDVRILENQVVITRVAENSPAAKAGLRPGFIIKSVDDVMLERGFKYASVAPDASSLINFRLRHEILIDHIGGAPGTDVHLMYLDEQNQERKVAIRRERLSGELSPPIGNFPPLYAEFETKRLPGDVEYIRFSVFVPQLTEKICGAIRSTNNAAGIVIDLRGNPGGIMGMASGVAGLLTTEAGFIGSIQTRKGALPLMSFPQRSPYTSPVVILIDALSASTAEVFAAALQESGRAVIVGERSAGMVLGADTVKLPTGALFMFARTGFKTSKGVALEGKGVTPDALKKLDRNALLKGQDDQLEEALRQIQLQIQLQKSRVAVKAPPPPPPVAARASIGAAAASSSPGIIEKSARETSDAAQTKHSFVSTPEADQIMERYIRAVGGREALLHLKSRVSTGTCSFPLQGMTGKVVIYEQAPNKRSTEIQIPNTGIMQIGFDGARGWMQHPLMGIIEFKEPVLSSLRRDFDFYKLVKYRGQFARMDYKGTQNTDSGRNNVLVLTTPEGLAEEMRFDVGTGLLVYDAGVYLGDYRQAGTVKVPFQTRVSIAGLDMTIKLDQVKQDMPISADAFAERESCLTRR